MYNKNSKLLQDMNRQPKSHISLLLSGNNTGPLDALISFKGGCKQHRENSQEEKWDCVARIQWCSGNLLGARHLFSLAA